MKIKNWNKWIFEGFDTNEYYVEVDMTKIGNPTSITDKESELLDKFLKEYRRKYLKGMVFYIEERKYFDKGIVYKINPYKNILMSINKHDDDYYSVSVVLTAMWVPTNPGAWDFSEESWITRSKTHGITGVNIKHYKCDQWDGLIKCLEDLLSKYKNKGI